jgi:hypothetical protein
MRLNLPRRSTILKNLLRRIRQYREPQVTICIPAWRSESFIEGTLRCAQDQTHSKLRILVSVDACDDATAEICQAHARADQRIEVFVQKERLGWARNVNYLLDRVQTEFYFLYFHDDVIEKSYTARLLARLTDRADAISAHCDMGHFGAPAAVSIGRDYEGGPVARLCTFLLAPDRGSPLRSLTRTSALRGGLRMPTDAPDGFWANEPYLMRLIGAGPALRVPEILYTRWNRREGGLTAGWTSLKREQIVAGLRANTQTALGIIDDIPATETEREVLRFAAYIFMLRKVAYVESASGGVIRIQPDELSSAFADMHIPPGFSQMDAEIQDWAHCAFAELSTSAAAEPQ